MRQTVIAFNLNFYLLQVCNEMCLNTYLSISFSQKIVFDVAVYDLEHESPYTKNKQLM